MSTSAVIVCVIICSVAYVRPALGTPLAMYFKKSSWDCVSEAGNCYNTEECCTGFTCAALDSEDDSAETPGRCILGKNLTPCTSSDDCDGGDETCSALKDSQGQKYCLPTSADSDEDDFSPMSNGPGKHQAFSTMLSDYGGLCETSADCVPYSEINGGPRIRICCQKVRRGRQGDRRICDRVTAISICIQPTM